ncbi:hypothetical protein B0H14DRAFT_3494530 [Mycena olivaceomarginata]|nr:hypothetical protein B0H14DRAFT_3494530 [Mycena olivaceomarginata]
MGLDDMPLLKRRRVSDCAARSCELRFASSAILKTLAQDPPKAASMFRHFFPACCISPQPSPSETDRIDGCPSVTLVGDALADWEVVFGWIYHKDDFLAKALTFDILSGALRISTKYEIAELRQWPVDVANMRLNALPHTAEAINLAQECNLPEILSSCFYALSRIEIPLQHRRRALAHLLSPNDLRRLIAGCEALQDALSPWGTWLVHELEQMLRDEAFVGTLCSDFVHGHLSTIRWRLGLLRGAIPGFFLL